MIIFIANALIIFILVLIILALILLLIQRNEIQKQLKILQEKEQELLFKNK